MPRGANAVNAANKYYNARGLAWQACVPHTATGTEAFLDSDWASYSGDSTRPSYDELGRVTQVILPDNRTTQTVYDGWSREAIDPKGHKRRYESDWAGRMTTVREYTGSNPYTEYAVTAYAYDAADQLLSVTDAASNLTRLTYDNLGRKTRMVDPDMGTWSYEYDPVGTLSAQTDAREQRTEYAYDKLGRLVRQWHAAFWTRDPIEAGVHPVGVYDLMELRCAVDVDRVAAGLSAYSWTDAALVAGTTTPIRAVHFTELKAAIQGLWTAAGLGTISEFGGGAVVSGTRTVKDSDPKELRKWLAQYEQSNYGLTHRARAYYEYDGYDGTSQFGKGRRTAMWDVCGYHKAYFDKAGRRWKEERTLDGEMYTTQWSYDALSRVYRTTLPDNEVLTHSYGAHGLLTQLSGDVGPTTYVSGVQYNALSLPTQYDLGGTSSGRVAHSYYVLDYQSPSYPYGAVRTIQWPASGAGLVNLTLSYDDAANVTGANDGVNGENISYGYDALDRLTSAGSPISETYSYDEIGNMTAKAGVSYSYGDPAHVHAVTSLSSGGSFGYDANGSMVTRGIQAIRYDPGRRPVRVDSNGVAAWRAAYDGDGARRKRLDSTGTVHYLGAYEKNLGNGQETAAVVTKYYYALGRLVAFRKGGTLYWVGTDHLGGTARVADSGFSALAKRRYSPYGVNRDASENLNSDRGFTSQVEDVSVGLYWYGSRAYDPALGRFCQADTILPDLDNPQAMNRFGYVLNNPLRFTDPTGHQPDERVRYIDFEGQRVRIVEYSEGLAGVLVRSMAGEGGAQVFSGNAIVGTGEVTGDLLTHELGHVRQARRMGASYLPTYVSQLMELRGQFYPKYGAEYARDLAYKYHPMEVGANREQGLRPYWHVEWRPVPSLRELDRLVGLPSAATGGLGSPVGPAPTGIVGAPTVSAEGTVVVPVSGRPTDISNIPDNVELTIPAEYAPGGVGVVGITSTNPSGGPASGGSWDSPGGGSPKADAEARRAAWEAAGSPDYNELRARGEPGY